MMATGFVLAGGKSARMGRDKAQLPFRGRTLVEHIAQAVREAVGNVTIVGQPNGVPDQKAGLGPIGGLFTALGVTQTDWNLVVACDMPGIDPESLRALLRRAQVSSAGCVAAESAGSLQPLCAVYHRRCLPEVGRAIEDKRLKMLDLLARLDVDSVPLDTRAVANANTPEEWAVLQNEPK